MSQGTLYGDIQTRCILPVGIVEAYDLDIAVAAQDAIPKAAFATEKVPAFIGEHGFKLQESIAIIFYCTLNFYYYLPIYFISVIDLTTQYFFITMMKKIHSIKQLSLS